ncbi:uncharacterized protein [Erythrolamprus reginae]
MIQPNPRLPPAPGRLLLLLLLLGSLPFFGPRGPSAEAGSEAVSGAAPPSNHSLNGTAGVPLTCQSFQCSGERCYQEEALGNSSQLCPNASHCELFRLNSSSYHARCSGDCADANATEMCLQGGALGTELCLMECCSSPNCLRLNATVYGDRATTTTPVPTTTTATTTTAAPPRNGKVCSSFTCHGEGCFKGQKSSTGCLVGHDFCEMKKTGAHFVAGCSQSCRTKGHPCAHTSTAACYQECCPARPKTSCLKLDGKVHFNRASGLASTSLFQLLAWAVLLSLSCARPSLAGTN